jgi:S-layer protein
LAANLNSFDVINGGAGTDTLNIDDTATGALANFAGATISNVENLVIQSKLGLLDAALNTTTTLPGLTSLKVGMIAGLAQTITAATTTALDITNTTANDITVVGGGTTASVVTAGAGKVLVGQATAPASTDANKFTSVSAKTGTGTVDITDNSGAAGVVGNTLTSVSVTGTVGATTGTSTLTGKGLTSVTLKDTSGAVNIVNATVGGHALTLNVAGVTAGTITDSTATSALVTANATTAAGTGSAFTLAGDTITGLTVGGTKSVNLTSTLAKVATVTVTGSGGLTTDLSGDGASTTLGYVTSVDTTGSTAVLSAVNGTTANVITIGNSTSYAGGAGADNVTTGASTKALNLGAGNDKLTLTTALLATGATANGGDGVDTLAMTSTLAASVASSVFNAQLSNFERLEITSAAPTGGIAATPVNVAQTIELGFLSNVNSYVKYNGIGAVEFNTNAQTLNNLANNGTVELAGDIAATYGSLIVNVANAAFGTEDSVNLLLSTTTDAVRAAGKVTIANVETFNITTSNGATTPTAQTDTITLTAAAAKTITVSGNAGLDMSVAATGTAVTSINASGITLGDFKVTTGALAAAATIVGTAQGANTIDASFATKSVNISVGAGKVGVSNVLKGGAAADIIVGGAGDDTITSGGGLDSLTGGGGKDTFIIADGSGTSTSRVVITDYVRTASSGSSDLLNFAGDAVTSTIAVAGFTVTNGVYVKAGASIADFYAGLADGAANSVAAFEAGGNTYVIYTGATTGATDNVFVELTGVTGLTSVSINAGANALFIA